MQLRSGVPACVAAPHLLGRRPSPVSDLRLVDSFRVGVVDAFNDLALEPLFQMFGSTLQSRHAVNDIDGEVEAVDLVTNRQFQRSIDVSPLHISTHVNVDMICAPIGELVNEPRISMEIEDNRLVRSEKRVKVAVR